MVLPEDIYRWFHYEARSHERIEVMCHLIQFLLPQEVRYVGTCLEDLGRKDSMTLQDSIQRANELSDNSLNLSLMDDHGRACTILALSLLRSDNMHSATQKLFHALQYFEQAVTMFLNDVAAKEEVLLIYTLASYHPAFSFQQHLYLQKCLANLHKYFRPHCLPASAHVIPQPSSKMPNKSTETSPPITNSPQSNHCNEKPLLAPPSLISDAKSSPANPQCISSTGHSAHILDFKLLDDSGRSSTTPHTFLFEVTWSNGLVTELLRTWDQCVAVDQELNPSSQPDEGHTVSWLQEHPANLPNVQHWAEQIKRYHLSELSMACQQKTNLVILQFFNVKEATVSMINESSTSEATTLRSPSNSTMRRQPASCIGLWPAEQSSATTTASEEILRNGRHSPGNSGQEIVASAGYACRPMKEDYEVQPNFRPLPNAGYSEGVNVTKHGLSNSNGVPETRHTEIVNNMEPVARYSLDYAVDDPMRFREVFGPLKDTTATEEYHSTMADNDVTLTEKGLSEMEDEVEDEKVLHDDVVSMTEKSQPPAFTEAVHFHLPLSGSETGADSHRLGSSPEEDSETRDSATLPTISPTLRESEFFHMPPPQLPAFPHMGLGPSNVMNLFASGYAVQHPTFTFLRPPSAAAPCLYPNPPPTLLQYLGAVAPPPHPYTCLSAPPQFFTNDNKAVMVTEATEFLPGGPPHSHSYSPSHPDNATGSFTLPPQSNSGASSSNRPESAYLVNMALGHSTPGVSTSSLLPNPVLFNPMEPQGLAQLQIYLPNTAAVQPGSHEISPMSGTANSNMTMAPPPPPPASCPLPSNVMDNPGSSQSCQQKTFNNDELRVSDASSPDSGMQPVAATAVPPSSQSQKSSHMEVSRNPGPGVPTLCHDETTFRRLMQPVPPPSLNFDFYRASFANTFLPVSLPTTQPLVLQRHPAPPYLPSIQIPQSTGAVPPLPTPVTTPQHMQSASTPVPMPVSQQQQQQQQHHVRLVSNPTTSSRPSGPRYGHVGRNQQYHDSYPQHPRATGLPPGRPPVPYSYTAGAYPPPRENLSQPPPQIIAPGHFLPPVPVAHPPRVPSALWSRPPAYPLITCSNCGSPGHKGLQCQHPATNDLSNNDYVVNYNRPAASLHPNTSQ